MRPRDAGGFERRRLRAVALLSQGIEPHVVAERLGVDGRSVRRWSQSGREQGMLPPRILEGEDGSDEPIRPPQSRLR